MMVDDDDLEKLQDEFLKTSRMAVGSVILDDSIKEDETIPFTTPSRRLFDT